MVSQGNSETYETYITKFVHLCEQIEQHFIKDNTPYFFGSTPTVVDFIFYQELVSAMLVSKKGSTSKFFKEDTATRLKLKKITEWYKKMSEI